MKNKLKFLIEANYMILNGIAISLRLSFVGNYSRMGSQKFENLKTNLIEEDYGDHQGLPLHVKYYCATAP